MKYIKMIGKKIEDTPLEIILLGYIGFCTGFTAGLFVF